MSSLKEGERSAAASINEATKLFFEGFGDDSGAWISLVDGGDAASILV